MNLDEKLKRLEVVIVTHAFLAKDKDVPGPAHSLTSYLKKRQIPCLFIRHSLFKEGQTLTTYFDGKSSIDFKARFKIFSWEPFLRLAEGFWTLKLFWRFFAKKKPIFIGIDPLNSFWGFILKKMGRVSRLITFTADYSQERYPNKFYNFFYHWLDRTTAKNCDLLMAVSKRILDLRKRQGINPKILVHIPNAPFFSEIKPLVKKETNPSNLVTIATLSRAIDFSILFEAVKELSGKFPKIKLTIIGAGPALENLKNETKKMKIDKNVIFMGAKPHQEVFKVLANHGIGLALYTDKAPWTFYSDSMKARDFLALGLPVIISGNLGTVEEIKNNNAGIVIECNKKELVSAVKTLLTNKKLYERYRNNALKLAKETDIDKILTRALFRLWNH